MCQHFYLTVFVAVMLTHGWMHMQTYTPPSLPVGLEVSEVV